MEVLNPTVHLSIQQDGKLDLAATVFAPNASFREAGVTVAPFEGIGLDLNDAITIQLRISKAPKILSAVQLHPKPLYWEELGIEADTTKKQIFVVFVLEDGTTLLASHVIDLDIQKAVKASGAQRFSDLEEAADKLLRESQGDIRLLKKLKDRPH